MGLGKGQEQEALARAMEEAFAAGPPPLGITADSHAAALAWTPPGFDAVGAGVEDGGAEGTPAAEESEPAADPEALSEPEDAGPVERVEPQSAPADPPEPVVENVEAPEAAGPGAAAIAANGHDKGDGLDIPQFLRGV